MEYINYLFCVGFGLLGGIPLRLATASCSSFDFEPCLCERDLNDGYIFENRDEDG